MPRISCRSYIITLMNLRPVVLLGASVMPLAVADLETAIETLRGRVELSLEVFRGIVNGIMQAHEAGIIHWDLKPQNVLFMDRNLREPLVADFGVCLLKETSKEDRLTDVNETVGAKWFMSPEQQKGGPTSVGETADMYALGKLLAYMLTGRFIHREQLDEVFTDEELRADPRRLAIRDRLLRRTIVERPEARIQTAAELLAIVDRLLEDFRGGSGDGRIAKPPVHPTVPDAPAVDAFQDARIAIRDGATRALTMKFDDLRVGFDRAWRIKFHEDARGSARNLNEIAAALIKSQGTAIGLSLALARYDVSDLYPSFKKHLEFLTDFTADEPGDPAVNSLPGLVAGFLYMSSSVLALSTESWSYWQSLLATTFRWHYRSGRPLFTPGFGHPYFFHPEALKRSASDTHDLYRKVLTQPELSVITEMKEEKALTAYVQTQFMMCIRGAQLNEQGKGLRMFADFGRFYGERVTVLLHRITDDQDYANGVLRPFAENRKEWFRTLNGRLQYVQKNFWGGSGFFWESIGEWE